MTKFVVYGASRTGSHYLQTLLHSHPRISCYWDIFWGRGNTELCYNSYVAARKVPQLVYKLNRKRIISEYLEHYFSQGPETQASGFLLKWAGAARYPEILSWLRNNDARIVHIVRCNVLVREIALELRRSGIVKSHARETIEFNKVRIDPESLLSNLRAMRKAVEKQRNMLRRHQVLEVQYEALLLNEELELERILAFLGVESIGKLKSEFEKTESESPEEMIENYDEVRSVLTGTEFETFLNV